MKKIVYCLILFILIFISGCDNESTNEIEFRVSNGILEWKYISDSDWIPIYDINENNQNQKDNDKIEFRVDANNLEWKYSSEENWISLFNLSNLKGEDGEEIMIKEIDNKLYWGFDEDELSLLVDLNDLVEKNEQKLQFVVIDNVMMWKYISDDTWNELLDFNDVFKKPVFEIIDNKLYWGYNNELNELFDLSLLKGEKGENGDSILLEVIDNKLYCKYNNEEKDLIFDFNSIIKNEPENIEFKTENMILKWKYSDKETWNELFSFEELADEIAEEVLKREEITNIEALEKVQYALNEVIATSEKATRGIANYQKNKNGDLVKSSVGSGFIYKLEAYTAYNVKTDNLNDPNIKYYKYYIITNRHVVIDSDKIKVYIYEDDEEYDATLIKYDDKVDAAVVTFTYSKYIKPLNLGDSNKVLSGDFVLAIGNPEGFKYSSSVTLGIVSYPIRYISVDTDDDDINDWELACIQHDCAINPGNSGGPLLDIYGNVIGINTLKFATTDIDNMGFSIIIDTIKDLIPYLENGVTPERIKLGIQVSTIRELLTTDKSTWEYEYIIPENVNTGIYVSNVAEDALVKDIIQKDDIILEFDGVKIKQNLDLSKALYQLIKGSGKEVPIVILRNGIEQTVYLVV